MDHAEEHELKDAIKRKYPVHKNCVSKADLRKLRDEMAQKHDEYLQGDYDNDQCLRAMELNRWRNKIDNLLERE